MRFRLIRRATGALVLYVLFSAMSVANTVAILDQGYNSTLSHRGFSKFVTQHCISYADRSVEQTGPPPPGFSVVISPFNASLCRNGATQQFFNGGAAFHPRTFVERVTQNSFTTSNRLDHARDMSNAIWDFNRSIFHQHFQVFGMAGNQKNVIRTLVDIVADPGSYKTNSGFNIAQALNFLSLNNDPNLGAVVIATVVGNRVNTPSTCNSLLGQEAVNRLRSKGIPVIAGLANNDIPSGTKTWPNCLFGVINAGRTDGFAPPFNGIGIGSNGIDFYTSSAVKNGTITSFGNSFAAPKIATAFAQLHKAHPNATVDQKYRALQRASSSMFTYKGVKRRRIRSSQIKNAISELASIISGDNNNNNNPNDDVHFDPTNYGVAFGGSSSDKVEVEIDFSSLVATKVSGVNVSSNASPLQSATPNEQRDVLLSFTGIFDENLSSRRKFRVKLNGALIETIDGFSKNQEATKSLIINRNLFRSGSNVLKIEPLSRFYKWGVKDISVKLLPAIPLTVGTKDTNQYGYSETPTRYTGARFKFELADRNFDHKVTLTGWDIDGADETEVFLNGNSLGFLTVGALSSSYSIPDSFILPISMLSVGDNIIELQQREPGGSWLGFEFEKWAVKDILVEVARPDLSVVSVEIADRAIHKEKPFTVLAKIENQGDAPSSIVTINFHVSDDEIITPNDSVIGTSTLTAVNPNQIKDLVRAGLVTSLINKGYFLGLCVEGVVNELNTANNCSIGIRLNSNAASMVPILDLLFDD